MPYRTPATLPPTPPEPRRGSMRAWLRYQFAPAFVKCPYCNTRRCPHTNLVSYLCTVCMIIGVVAILRAAFWGR